MLDKMASAKSAVSRGSMFTRRRFIGSGVASTLAMRASPPPLASGPAAAGPVTADWTSLAADWRMPDWFRDAKFGIWAHWGAQAVPEFGVWYGRLIFVHVDPFYRHHLDHYGHPSKSGYLDITNLWKAEQWQPETLIGLYKQAGARYFT